jgi:hypothetical protein
MVAKAGAGATTSLKIVGSDPILEAGAKAAIAASKQRLASR